MARQGVQENKLLPSITTLEATHSNWRGKKKWKTTAIRDSSVQLK